MCKRAPKWLCECAKGSFRHVGMACEGAFFVTVDKCTTTGRIGASTHKPACLYVPNVGSVRSHKCAWGLWRVRESPCWHVRIPDLFLGLIPSCVRHRRSCVSSRPRRNSSQASFCVHVLVCVTWTSKGASFRGCFFRNQNETKASMDQGPVHNL